MAVTIERTANEFVVKLPLHINPLDIQKVLDQFQFLEIVSKSQATEEDINELSKLVKAGWSQEMKDRLAAMDEFKDVFE
ncbi:MAG: hypothetical protein AAGI23_23305 [Bacteroidota bacterium]